MLRYLVCVKQVPDTTEVRIDPVTNTLVRAGVPSILNPFDRSAVETALTLREQTGGKVTVISMGPPQAMDVLRECMTLGADETALISDRAFGGADTLATSYTLAKAIESLGGADLILCGKQAIDGDTAQVGPEIAEHLGLPQLTFVEELCFEEGTVKAVRDLDGEKEVVCAPLPAVVTIVKPMGEKRYGTIARRLAANRTEIPMITASDLEADPDRLGLNGSPTKVRKVFTPTKEKIGTKLEGLTSAEAAAEIFKALDADGLL